VAKERRRERSEGEEDEGIVNITSHRRNSSIEFDDTGRIPDPSQSATETRAVFSHENDTEKSIRRADKNADRAQISDTETLLFKGCHGKH